MKQFSGGDIYNYRYGPRGGGDSSQLQTYLLESTNLVLLHFFYYFIHVFLVCSVDFLNRNLEHNSIMSVCIKEGKNSYYFVYC